MKAGQRKHQMEKKVWILLGAGKGLPEGIREYRIIGEGKINNNNNKDEGENKETI